MEISLDNQPIATIDNGNLKYLVDVDESLDLLIKCKLTVVANRLKFANASCYLFSSEIGELSFKVQ